MIDITLTQFVNFIASQGLTRIETASLIRLQSQMEYDVKKDFYKKIRENLVRFERRDTTLEQLRLALSSVTPSKRSSYRALLSSYFTWRNRYSRVSFFEPPTGAWQSGQLRVRVNPELGLALDGRRTLVKLHFKKNPLSELRAAMILHIMHHALNGDFSVRVALLEVRTGELHVLDEVNPDASILIEAEAAALVTAWRLLQRRNVSIGDRG